MDDKTVPYNRFETVLQWGPASEARSGVPGVAARLGALGLLQWGPASEARSGIYVRPLPAELQKLQWGPASEARSGVRVSDADRGAWTASMGPGL